MKKVVALILLSVFTVGCSMEGKIRRASLKDSPCGEDVEAYTYTNINYGDGHISVRTRTEIEPGSEWRFYLKPKKRMGGALVFGDSMVTVEGKAENTMVMNPDKNALVKYKIPVPPGNSDWLKESKSFNSAPYKKGKIPYFVICVPEELEDKQDWYYKVHIENVGEVDPRGRVEK